MDETLTKSLIFLTGCLIGTTVTYLALKRRFDERLARETEEAREWLNKRKETVQIGDKPKIYPRKPLALNSIPEDDLKTCSEISRIIDEAIEKEMKAADELPIYPITADEFGEQGYTETQLYFYAADETLVDADDNVIDPDETNVGEDGVDIFVYTDAENAYVRNKETKTDYEILRIEGSFASIESEGLYE